MLALLVVLVPVGTVSVALLSLDERHEAAEELQGALDKAAHSYHSRTGLQAELAEAEEEAAASARALAELQERRLSVRADLGSFLRSAADSDILELPEGSMVRRLLLDDMPTPSAALDRELRRRIRALRRQDLFAGLSLEERHRLLTMQWRQISTDEAAAKKRADAAAAKATRLARAVADIPRIMNDVHHQVLELQATLARIDARLKAKAERALLERGLLDPRHRTGATIIVGTNDLHLLWPAHGKTTAGFHDAPYEQYFGVPHHGMDIAAQHGSPVYSAADGVVFVVRDGGALGYTYILIGHRNGIATLYGHLSSAAVAAGQEVKAGQIVGLSGGTPGTPGAGPMTTGAHLHFEVIVAGSNVDPKAVLP